MLSYDAETRTSAREELMDATSMVNSPVDITALDGARFPRAAARMPPVVCAVDEGEVLYLPSFWWCVGAHAWSHQTLSRRERARAHIHVYTRARMHAGTRCSRGPTRRA